MATKPRSNPKPGTKSSARSARPRVNGQKVLTMPQPPPQPPPPASTPAPDPPVATSIEKFGVFELDVAEDYHGILQLLYDERLKAKNAEDCAIVARKALDEQLESLLDDIGYSRVFMPDGCKIVVANGRSASSLNKHKLIEAGVDPDVIVACTDPGNFYTYVQTPKQSKEDAVTIEMLKSIRARSRAAMAGAE